MIKAILKWTALVVCSLSIGVAYSVLTPDQTIAGPGPDCSCGCVDQAPFLQYTEECQGLGWFSYPCRIKDSVCNVHTCAGSPPIFDGCME